MAIQAINLVKSFGNPSQPVLRSISLEIKDSEFVAITGRSGSGKSTLLYVLSTLDLPTSGEVIIDDESVAGMSVERLHEFRNLNLGFVFQFHHLLPELTALENVLLPAMKKKKEKMKKGEAMALLDELGIGHIAQRFPSQISGGEQQRVAIARALIMRPRYVFADEPTGNLDSKNSLLVMDIFKRINQKNKTTIIFVTHDQGLADMALRQITMVDGEVV